MNYDKERKTIEEYLVANFSTLPMRFANPKSKSFENIEFVHIEIISGESEKITFGSLTNTFRYVGLITCQIFIKLGQGSGPALVIADELSTILSDKQISNVVTNASRIDKIGPQDDYYQINVVTRFKRDENF